MSLERLKCVLHMFSRSFWGGVERLKGNHADWKNTGCYLRCRCDDRRQHCELDLLGGQFPCVCWIKIFLAFVELIISSRLLD